MKYDYERIVQTFNQICIDNNIAFVHLREFDIATYKGDFPVVWFFPLKQNTIVNNGQVFNAEFLGEFAIFVKNQTNTDRTKFLDLQNIYDCENLYKTIIKNILDTQSIVIKSLGYTAEPFLVKGSFSGTALIVNFVLSVSYEIDYCYD